MERNAAGGLTASTQVKKRQQQAAVWLLGLACISPSMGCSLWGKSELKQYQEENKRLLSDFRSQRDRAEQLEIEKRALVGRLKDLEGRMAAIADAVQDPAGPLANSNVGDVPRGNSSGGVPIVPASKPQSQSFSLPQNFSPPSSALDAWQAQDAP